MNQLFVCPHCHNNIGCDGKCFYCVECKSKWNIKYGIPTFAEEEYYWNQIDKSDMKELLQVAKEEGYESALQKCLLPKTNPYVYNYALNESRGDFRFILPLDSQSRILDIGCGWGSVTSALARTCGEVVGADTNIYTLQFLQLRAEQEKLSNIRFAHIEPLDKALLPFPDAYFDLVVMNGVLEWIGTAVTDEKPDHLQNKALREVRRVLKDHGELYIGIENRFGYHYFLGACDEHSELRLTNLLPRWIADKYLHVRMGTAYRTYTYSILGYRSLLSKAGFKATEFYAPVRSYREPEFIIPLGDQKIINYYLANYMSRRTNKHRIVYVFSRILSALRLFKFFVPSYSIVAEAV